MTDKEIIKRLEAENEKLKKEILSQNDYILQLSADSEKMEWLGDDIKELKAENERLKIENSNLDNRNCTDLKMLHNCNSRLQHYKQTLAEIKEIAENIVNNDDKPSCVNDADCPLNGGLGYDNHCNTKCPFILGKQILEKISEVMK